MNTLCFWRDQITTPLKPVGFAHGPRWSRWARQPEHFVGQYLVGAEYWFSPPYPRQELDVRFQMDETRGHFYWFTPTLCGIIHDINTHPPHKFVAAGLLTVVAGHSNVDKRLSASEVQSLLGCYLSHYAVPVSVCMTATPV